MKIKSESGCTVEVVLASVQPLYMYIITNLIQVMRAIYAACFAFQYLACDAYVVLMLFYTE
jgi:hypothetical protein